MRNIPTIAGAGGGSQPRPPMETPNSVRSTQIARIIDLISEGPIKGVVGGMQGIFFDGVPLQYSDGSIAFENLLVQQTLGYPDQPLLSGFNYQEQETAVGVQLRFAQPITRTVINQEADLVRLTFSTPTLQEVDNETGDNYGALVQWRVAINTAGGGWVDLPYYQLWEKTTSRYQVSSLIRLSGSGPWDIRVTRLSEDSTSQFLQNDLYWDSITELTDDRVNFAHSAVIGVQIDAQQFNAIPRRTFLVDGLLCRIPSNYDPYLGVYDGVWDGNFKIDWTNNPSWVLYDLLTQNRYGLGAFLTPAMVDKWSFYAVGQYCDGRVSDGRGSTERRYVCNAVINSQVEAFDLVNEIAAICRGFCYWSGNQIVMAADMPADPQHMFTNANAIEGVFTYSGSDLRDRHTMVAVSWKDPKLLGDTRISVIEDAEALSRYGIQQLDVAALGASTEGQAVRIGRWAIYTEQHESERIAFRTSLEGIQVAPGMLIQVMDVNIAGVRRGGRIGAGSTAEIVVFDDASVGLAPLRYYRLSCVIGEGVVETRDAGTGSTLINDHTIKVSPPFSAAPQPDTVFVLNEPEILEPTLWRVTVIRQVESNLYEVEGVRHLPSKYDHIDAGFALDDPDITDIALLPPPVTDLRASEYLVQLSPISVGVRATLSWQSRAAQFEVSWRRVGDNWTTQRTDRLAIDLPVTEADYEFAVRPISSLGYRGTAVILRQTIIGRTAPPAAPVQFRINVMDAVAHFDWLPAPELDVIIGGHFELRHSSRTSGATWNTAQVVIPSIPGSATSVEAGYQVGTWFLRTFDVLGIPSAGTAAVLAMAPDGRYAQYYRICENPGFLGTRSGTEVRLDQDWLVIGETGGLWDAQTDPMDTWANVDVLPQIGPEPPMPQGSYQFFNRLDAGAPFSIRLSADILAFPFFDDADAFIDSRLTPVDTWQNWDDPTGDLEGTVTILIRSTEGDPAAPNAVWSPWKTFIAGEHYGRGFEFQALLEAPTGQNIGVETLCIIADMRNKIDEGADVPYPAATVRVTFRIKFFTVPAVVVTVQEGQSTDNVTILNKTREYFDIEIKNNSGVHQTRTFDWHAQGY